MADKKISALTGATTPLTGTEVLPIVQGSATVKVSVDNLTSGRAVNSAGGTFTDNFVQGTAVKGVNFTANTPAAGMTSQLLNWYEEGTWTPGFAGWTTAPSVVSAVYTRIGRQVTVTMYGVNGVNASNNITGLPFTAGTGSAGIINASSTTMYLGCSALPGTAYIGGFNMDMTGNYWQLAITYFI